MAAQINPVAIVSDKYAQLGKLDEAIFGMKSAEVQRAASAVTHPHVVRMLEVLELEGGAPAIVMEHVEGETLKSEIERAGDQHTFPDAAAILAKALARPIKYVQVPI